MQDSKREERESTRMKVGVIGKTKRTRTADWVVGTKKNSFFIFLILKNLGTKSGIGKEKYYPLPDPKFI